MGRGKGRLAGQKGRDDRPGARGVDLDALPPLLRYTKARGEGGAVRPLNRAAAALSLEAELHDVISKVAATAVASARPESLDVTSGGTQWLAMAFPLAGGDAQLLVLPLVLEPDTSSLAAVAPGLTAREREVLHLVFLGVSSRDISERLEISWHTVRTHVKNACRILGVRTRAELARFKAGALRTRVRARLG